MSPHLYLWTWELFKNFFFAFLQTWIQDLLLQDQDQDQDQDLLIQDQDQDQDSEVPRPRPRPRPRLSSFKTKTKTKTLMSKIKTETQDLKDQHWKSMIGMDFDKQKDWKVMTSRKSSTPVDIMLCLTTVLFPQLPLIIAVYQTFANTVYMQHFNSMMFDQQLKR